MYPARKTRSPNIPAQTVPGVPLSVDAQLTIRPATKTESDCRSTAADNTTLQRDRPGTGVIPVHVTRLFSLFTADSTVKKFGPILLAAATRPM